MNLYIKCYKDEQRDNLHVYIYIICIFVFIIFIIYKKSKVFQKFMIMTKKRNIIDTYIPCIL